MSTTQDPPPTVGIDDAYGRTFADVRSRLADLVDTPTWSLDDARLDQRISDALAARAAIDEVVARLVGEADDRNLPHRHGASSTRAHLMTTHRMSAGEASRTVRTAKQLHGTSAVTEPVRRAVATGVVSAEQGVVVAEAIHRLSPRVEPDRVDVAQADLIGHAQRLSFTQLQVAANHLVEVVDPDTADQLLEQQLAEQERTGAGRRRSSPASTAPTGSPGAATPCRTSRSRCSRNTSTHWPHPDAPPPAPAPVTTPPRQTRRPTRRWRRRPSVTSRTATGSDRRSVSSSNTSPPTDTPTTVLRTRPSWSPSTKPDSGPGRGSHPRHRRRHLHRCRPAGWRATPASCRWSSRVTPASWTSARRSVCSTATNASR